MELELIWTSFLTDMNHVESVQHCYRKNITGIPFIYVEIANEYASAWDESGLTHIHACAKKAMFKKKVTTETHFVRKDDNLFVYRHRFYVPQEKMFCCGNLCMDCIRLKKK